MVMPGASAVTSPELETDAAPEFPVVHEMAAPVSIARRSVYTVAVA